MERGRVSAATRLTVAMASPELVPGFMLPVIGAEIYKL